MIDNDSDLTWKISIYGKKENRNNESGSFIAHIYSYDSHGNSVGIGGVTVQVTP